MVAIERQGAGEQPPELLGRVAPSLGSAKTGIGVDWWLGGWDLKDGVGVDAAVVLGRLEDAVEQGPAGQHGVVADLAPQLVLPAAHQADGDGAELVLAEERQHIAAQAALGGLQGGGAAVEVGGPHLPPLARPGLEGLLAEAGVDPAAAGQPGEQVMLEVAGLIPGVEGLAALAGVIEPPPDLVAAGRGLADACGGHRHSRLRSARTNGPGRGVDVVGCRPGRLGTGIGNRPCVGCERPQAAGAGRVRV
jgi:hypothetical protein